MPHTPVRVFMSCSIGVWESKSSLLGHPGQGGKASKLGQEAPEKQCQTTPRKRGGQESALSAHIPARSRQSPGSAAVAGGTTSTQTRMEGAGKLPAPRRGCKDPSTPPVKAGTPGSSGLGVAGGGAATCAIGRQVLAAPQFTGI